MKIDGSVFYGKSSLVASVPVSDQYIKHRCWV